MRQVFLKFSDEAEALGVLKGYADNPAYAIDIIGVMYDIEGEGEKIKATAKPGFHVNMLAPSNFGSEYEIFPETPSRIFAGWDK